MSALTWILIGLYAAAGVWMLTTISRSNREAVASYIAFVVLGLSALVVDALGRLQ